MTNPKKLITDRVFASRAEAMATLGEAITNANENGLVPDVWAIIKDNFPTSQIEENGETLDVSPLYPDEQGAPMLDDNADLGALAMVTIYGEQSVQPAGSDPLAVPEAIYMLSLPTDDELMQDEKLRAILQDTLAKKRLAAARAIAKKNHKDEAGAPLARDRVAALLSAARTAGSPDKAFKAVFPVLQSLILRNVADTAARFKDAGKHAQARAILATYSKPRLSLDIMRECLSSKQAAERHFPNMGQNQWETILRAAIAWCPKHYVMKLVKDDAGNTVKTTDANGKEIAVREKVAAPQSPTIFLTWLETRETATLAPVEQDTLDLSDIMSDLPTAA